MDSYTIIPLNNGQELHNHIAAWIKFTNNVSNAYLSMTKAIQNECGTFKSSCSYLQGDHIHRNVVELSSYLITAVLKSTNTIEKQWLRQRDDSSSWTSLSRIDNKVELDLLNKQQELERIRKQEVNPLELAEQDYIDAAAKLEKIQDKSSRFGLGNKDRQVERQKQIMNKYHRKYIEFYSSEMKNRPKYIEAHKALENEWEERAVELLILFKNANNDFIQNLKCTSAGSSGALFGDLAAVFEKCNVPRLVNIALKNRQIKLNFPKKVELWINICSPRSTESGSDDDSDPDNNSTGMNAHQLETLDGDARDSNQTINSAVQSDCSEESSIKTSPQRKRKMKEASPKHNTESSIDAKASVPQEKSIVISRLEEPPSAHFTDSDSSIEDSKTSENPLNVFQTLGPISIFPGNIQNLKVTATEPNRRTGGISIHLMTDGPESFNQLNQTVPPVYIEYNTGPKQISPIAYDTQSQISTAHELQRVIQNVSGLPTTVAPTTDEKTDNMSVELVDSLIKQNKCITQEINGLGRKMEQLQEYIKHLDKWCSEVQEDVVKLNKVVGFYRYCGSDSDSKDYRNLIDTDSTDTAIPPVQKREVAQSVACPSAVSGQTSLEQLEEVTVEDLDLRIRVPQGMQECNGFNFSTDLAFQDKDSSEKKGSANDLNQELSKLKPLEDANANDDVPSFNNLDSTHSELYEDVLPKSPHLSLRKKFQERNKKIEDLSPTEKDIEPESHLAVKIESDSWDSDESELFSELHPEICVLHAGNELSTKYKRENDPEHETSLNENKVAYDGSDLKELPDLDKSTVKVEENTLNSWDSDDYDDDTNENPTDKYVVYNPENVADLKQQHDLAKPIDGQDNALKVEEMEANSWDSNSDDDDDTNEKPSDKYVVYNPENVNDLKEEHDLSKLIDEHDNVVDMKVEGVESNSWDSDVDDATNAKPTDKYVVYKPENVADLKQQHTLAKPIDRQDNALKVEEVEANSLDSDVDDATRENPTDKYVVYKPENVDELQEQHDLAKPIDGQDNALKFEEMEANSWDSGSYDDATKEKPADKYVVDKPENVDKLKEQHDLPNRIDGQDNETEDNVVVREVEETEANSWDSDDDDIKQEDQTDKYVVYKPENVTDLKEHDLGKPIDEHDNAQKVEEIEVNSWDSDEDDIKQENPADKYVVYKPKNVDDLKEQHDLGKPIDEHDNVVGLKMEEIEANSWDSDDGDATNEKPTDKYVVYKPENVADSEEQHDPGKPTDGKNKLDDDVEELELSFWDSDEDDVKQVDPTDDSDGCKPDEQPDYVVDLQKLVPQGTVAVDNVKELELSSWDGNEEEEIKDNIANSKEQVQDKTTDVRNETEDGVNVKREPNTWDGDEIEAIPENPTIVYKSEEELEIISDSKEVHDMDKPSYEQDQERKNVKVDNVEELEASRFGNDKEEELKDNITDSEQQQGLDKTTDIRNETKNSVKVEPNCWYNNKAAEIKANVADSKEKQGLDKTTDDQNEIENSVKVKLEASSWDSDEAEVILENSTDNYVVYKSEEELENVPDSKELHDMDKATDIQYGIEGEVEKVEQINVNSLNKYGTDKIEEIVADSKKQHVQEKPTDVDDATGYNLKVGTPNMENIEIFHQNSLDSEKAEKVRETIPDSRHGLVMTYGQDETQEKIIVNGVVAYSSYGDDDAESYICYGDNDAGSYSCNGDCEPGSYSCYGDDDAESYSCYGDDAGSHSCYGNGEAESYSCYGDGEAESYSCYGDGEAESYSCYGDVVQENSTDYCLHLNLKEQHENESSKIDTEEEVKEIEGSDQGLEEFPVQKTNGDKVVTDNQSVTLKDKYKENNCAGEQSVTASDEIEEEISWVSGHKEYGKTEIKTMEMPEFNDHTSQNEDIFDQGVTHENDLKVNIPVPSIVAESVDLESLTIENTFQQHSKRVSNFAASTLKTLAQSSETPREASASDQLSPREVQLEGGTKSPRSPSSPFVISYFEHDPEVGLSYKETSHVVEEAMESSVDMPHTSYLEGNENNMAQEEVEAFNAEVAHDKSKVRDPELGIEQAWSAISTNNKQQKRSFQVDEDGEIKEVFLYGMHSRFLDYETEQMLNDDPMSEMEDYENHLEYRNFQNGSHLMDYATENQSAEFLNNDDQDNSLMPGTETNSTKARVQYQTGSGANSCGRKYEILSIPDVKQNEIHGNTLEAVAVPTQINSHFGVEVMKNVFKTDKPSIKIPSSIPSIENETNIENQTEDTGSSEKKYQMIVKPIDHTTEKGDSKVTKGSLENVGGIAESSSVEHTADTDMNKISIIYEDQNLESKTNEPVYETEIFIPENEIHTHVEDQIEGSDLPTERKSPECVETVSNVDYTPVSCESATDLKKCMDLNEPLSQENTENFLKSQTIKDDRTEQFLKQMDTPLECPSQNDVVNKEFFMSGANTEAGKLLENVDEVDSDSASFTLASESEEIKSTIIMYEDKPNKQMENINLSHSEELYDKHKLEMNKGTISPVEILNSHFQTVSKSGKTDEQSTSKTEYSWSQKLSEEVLQVATSACEEGDNFRAAEAKQLNREESSHHTISETFPHGKETVEDFVVELVPNVVDTSVMKLLDIPKPVLECSLSKSGELPASSSNKKEIAESTIPSATNIERFAVDNEEVLEKEGQLLVLQSEELSDQKQSYTLGSDRNGIHKQLSSPVLDIAQPNSLIEHESFIEGSSKSSDFEILSDNSSEENVMKWIPGTASIPPTSIINNNELSECDSFEILSELSNEDVCEKNEYVMSKELIVNQHDHLQKNSIESDGKKPSVTKESREKEVFEENIRRTTNRSSVPRRPFSMMENMSFSERFQGYSREDEIKSISKGKNLDHNTETPSKQVSFTDKPVAFTEATFSLNLNQDKLPLIKTTEEKASVNTLEKSENSEKRLIESLNSKEKELGEMENDIDYCKLYVDEPLEEVPESVCKQVAKEASAFEIEMKTNTQQIPSTDVEDKKQIQKEELSPTNEIDYSKRYAEDTFEDMSATSDKETEKEPKSKKAFKDKQNTEHVKNNSKPNNERGKGQKKTNDKTYAESIQSDHTLFEFNSDEIFGPLESLPPSASKSSSSSLEQINALAIEATLKSPTKIPPLQVTPKPLPVEVIPSLCLPSDDTKSPLEELIIKWVTDSNDMSLPKSSIEERELEENSFEIVSESSTEKESELQCSTEIEDKSDVNSRNLEKQLTLKPTDINTESDIFENNECTSLGSNDKDSDEDTRALRGVFEYEFEDPNEATKKIPLPEKDEIRSILKSNEQKKHPTAENGLQQKKCISFYPGTMVREIHGRIEAINCGELDDLDDALEIAEPPLDSEAEDEQCPEDLFLNTLKNSYSNYLGINEETVLEAIKQQRDVEKNDGMVESLQDYSEGEYECSDDFDEYDELEIIPRGSGQSNLGISQNMFMSHVHKPKQSEMQSKCTNEDDSIEGSLSEEEHLTHLLECLPLNIDQVNERQEDDTENLCDFQQQTLVPGVNEIPAVEDCSESTSLRNYSNPNKCLLEYSNDTSQKENPLLLNNDDVIDKNLDADLQTVKPSKVNSKLYSCEKMKPQSHQSQDKVNLYTSQNQRSEGTNQKEKSILTVNSPLSSDTLVSCIFSNVKVNLYELDGTHSEVYRDEQVEIPQEVNQENQKDGDIFILASPSRRQFISNEQTINHLESVEMDNKSITSYSYPGASVEQKQSSILKHKSSSFRHRKFTSQTNKPEFIDRDGVMVPGSVDPAKPIAPSDPLTKGHNSVNQIEIDSNAGPEQPVTAKLSQFKDKHGYTIPKTHETASGSSSELERVEDVSTTQEQIMDNEGTSQPISFQKACTILEQKETCTKPNRNETSLAKTLESEEYKDDFVIISESSTSTCTNTSPKSELKYDDVSVTRIQFEDDSNSSYEDDPIKMVVASAVKDEPIKMQRIEISPRDALNSNIQNTSTHPGLKATDEVQVESDSSSSSFEPVQMVIASGGKVGPMKTETIETKDPTKINIISDDNTLLHCPGNLVTHGGKLDAVCSHDDDLSVKFDSESDIVTEHISHHDNQQNKVSEDDSLNETPKQKIKDFGEVSEDYSLNKTAKQKIKDLGEVFENLSHRQKRIQDSEEVIPRFLRTFIPENEPEKKQSNSSVYSYESSDPETTAQSSNFDHAEFQRLHDGHNRRNMPKYHEIHSVDERDNDFCSYELTDSEYHETPRPFLKSQNKQIDGLVNDGQVQNKEPIFNAYNESYSSDIRYQSFSDSSNSIEASECRNLKQNIPDIEANGIDSKNKHDSWKKVISCETEKVNNNIKSFLKDLQSDQAKVKFNQTLEKKATEINQELTKETQGPSNIKAGDWKNPKYIKKGVVEEYRNDEKNERLDRNLLKTLNHETEKVNDGVDEFLHEDLAKFKFNQELDKQEIDIENQETSSPITDERKTKELKAFHVKNKYLKKDSNQVTCRGLKLQSRVQHVESNPKEGDWSSFLELQAKEKHIDANAFAKDEASIAKAKKFIAPADDSRMKWIKDLHAQTSSDYAAFEREQQHLVEDLDQASQQQHSFETDYIHRMVPISYDHAVAQNEWAALTEAQMYSNAYPEVYDKPSETLKGMVYGTTLEIRREDARPGYSRPEQQLQAQEEWAAFTRTQQKEIQCPVLSNKTEEKIDSPLNKQSDLETKRRINMKKGETAPEIHQNARVEWKEFLEVQKQENQYPELSLESPNLLPNERNVPLGKEYEQTISCTKDISWANQSREKDQWSELLHKQMYDNIDRIYSPDKPISDNELTKLDSTLQKYAPETIPIGKKEEEVESRTKDASRFNQHKEIDDWAALLSAQKQDSTTIQIAVKDADREAVTSSPGESQEKNIEKAVENLDIPVLGQSSLPSFSQNVPGLQRKNKLTPLVIPEKSKSKKKKTKAGHKRKQHDAVCFDRINDQMPEQNIIDHLADISKGFYDEVGESSRENMNINPYAQATNPFGLSVDPNQGDQQHVVEYTTPRNDKYKAHNMNPTESEYSASKEEEFVDHMQPESTQYPGSSHTENIYETQHIPRGNMNVTKTISNEFESSNPFMTHVHTEKEGRRTNSAQLCSMPPTAPLLGRRHQAQKEKEEYERFQQAQHKNPIVGPFPAWNDMQAPPTIYQEEGFVKEDVVMNPLAGADTQIVASSSAVEETEKNLPDVFKLKKKKTNSMPAHREPADEKQHRPQSAEDPVHKGVLDDYYEEKRAYEDHLGGRSYMFSDNPILPVVPISMNPRSMIGSMIGSHPIQQLTPEQVMEHERMYAGQDPWGLGPRPHDARDIGPHDARDIDPHDARDIGPHDPRSIDPSDSRNYSPHGPKDSHLGDSRGFHEITAGQQSHASLNTPEESSTSQVGRLMNRRGKLANYGKPELLVKDMPSMSRQLPLRQKLQKSKLGQSEEEPKREVALPNRVIFRKAEERKGLPIDAFPPGYLEDILRKCDSGEIHPFQLPEDIFHTLFEFD